MSASKQFAVRKYDGDDEYSWAVFYAQDVRRFRGVVFYGQARPVAFGMTRSVAIWRRNKLEQERGGGKA